MTTTNLDPRDDSSPAVEAVGLVKHFGATEALRGVDLSVEFRSEGRRVITSPVRAITTEQPPGSVVH